MLALSCCALIAMAGLSSLLTAVVLEVQAGARAYILAESHWSRARKDAMFFLYRFAEHGDPQYLARAREALARPLSDRRGRLALEADPPDLQAARAAFLEGINSPDNLRRMVWMHRYFAEAPYFERAIRLWRECDDPLLALETVADRLERAHEQGGLDPALRRRLQASLVQIGAQHREIEQAFTDTLTAGVERLQRVLVALSALAFLFMAAACILFFVGAHRRIHRSERKFRALFEQAAVGLAELDRNGRFRSVNATLCRLLGLPAAALNGQRLQSFFPTRGEHEETGQPTERPTTDRALTTERRYLHRDGRERWGRVTLSMVRGQGGQAERLFAVVEDVTEARELADALNHQATHDRLTALVNRHAVEDHLEALLGQTRGTRRRHLFCFIDLDQFKIVNDTCGHFAGDRLLAQVADILRRTVRETDIVGRLGGDEFAAILHDVAPEEGERAAGKLLQRLRGQEFQWQGQRFRLTASIGMVALDAGVRDVPWVLRAADVACYMAKDRGRDRLQAYTAGDHSVLEHHGQIQWVQSIRRALDEDRLCLHAQRIRPVAPGAAPLDYELLVRLIGPDGEQHPPGAFMPAAERFDLATEIDTWVARHAFRQLAAHPEHLAALNRCHLNVSAQSLGDPRYRDLLEGLLDEYGIPGAKICLEITETAAVRSLKEAYLFIDRMQARGCRIALDDFGSGLSSFGYLKNLPVDLIKIDGLFVRDIAEDGLNRAIVEAINQIGRALGKRTIAEFVENATVLAELQRIGVDAAQGYGVHRPCAFERLLAEPGPRQSCAAAGPAG